MKNLLLLILLAGALQVTAQQDPIYAQYINNPLAINPAFAGSNNMFNAGLQYRTQWAGIEANPVTVNFNSHMSVYQNRVGLGVQVIQDKIGDTKNTEFSTVYAYKIKLNNASLSFGMQTGFIRYTNNPSALSIRDAGDAAFTQVTETKFNTGAGLLLKSDRYIVGLSVPRLLPATVSQGGQTVELYKQHYYLIGSYVMFVSEKLRFKPAMLLRGTSGSPFSADLNASFTMREFYTAGIFTRNFKTYGLLMQALVKNFRIGYVFELPGSPASSLNFTSHELTLGLSMGVLGMHDKVAKTF
ncbi:MAG: type IX secretion system membrane protein PorP/SprF [Cyclobacteriaceae bacterium]|nr:type IX secretion system membrane protein PorP/SprF [Cyclobacteriaceae bacterium]